MPAAKEDRAWPRARTVAGFVVLLTSIAMFTLDGFHLTTGLGDPAKLFLALAAYTLLGVSIPDLLRIVGAVIGNAGQTLSTTARELERTHAAEDREDERDDADA